MIQVHYISCALYFYDDYISPTSDYQALDLGGWGPLLHRNVSCDGDNEAVVTLITQSRNSQVSLDRPCACSSPGRRSHIWKYPGSCFPVSASWAGPSLSAILLQARLVKYVALNLQGPIYSAHQVLWPYGCFSRLPFKVMYSDHSYRSHWVSTALLVVWKS